MLFRSSPFSLPPLPLSLLSLLSPSSLPPLSLFPSLPLSPSLKSEGGIYFIFMNREGGRGREKEGEKREEGEGEERKRGRGEKRGKGKGERGKEGKRGKGKGGRGGRKKRREGGGGRFLLFIKFFCSPLLLSPLLLSPLLLSPFLLPFPLPPPPSRRYFKFVTHPRGWVTNLKKSQNRLTDFQDKGLPREEVMGERQAEVICGEGEGKRLRAKCADDQDQADRRCFDQVVEQLGPVKFRRTTGTRENLYPLFLPFLYS